MIPVEQTKTGRPWGNCWEACLASILEVPIDSVPDNRRDGDPNPRQDWNAVRKWLLTEHGGLLIYCSAKYAYRHVPSEEPYILLVYTTPEYGSLPHAVVAAGQEVIHNPHPGRSKWGWRGIAGVMGLEILVPVISLNRRWLTDEEVEELDPLPPAEPEKEA